MTASYATLRRRMAITELSNKWIHSGDHGAPGTIRRTPDFTELMLDVTKLRNVSPNNISWRVGVTEWTDTVARAIKLFCDENDFSYLTPPKYNDCTPTVKSEYERSFTWAVLQGAIFANYGA